VIALAVLAGGLALAAPPELSGLELGQVTLEAAEGGLPGDYLVPLLRSTTGEAYRAWLVREDLELLVRLGLFEAVEAHVQIGVTSGPEGEPVPVVQLTYRVQPAPTVRTVRLDGVRGLSAAVVRGAADAPPGSRWFASADEPSLEERITRLYLSEGYGDARVRVESRRVGGEQVDLHVQVDEGEPHRLVEVVVVGVEDPALERRVRRVLLRAGLVARRPPRRLPPEVLSTAGPAVLEDLRQAGYTSARVSVLASEGVKATVFVEAGDRTELETEGWGLQRVTVLPWRSSVLEGIVELPQRSRLGAWELEQMGGQLEEHLARRGYRDAWVEVEADVGEGGVRIVTLRGRAGRRVRVTREGMRFEGNTLFDDATLRRALAEAAPESLGRRSLLGRSQVTEEGLTRGLEAVRDLYRSQGHLQAEVTATPGQQRDVRRTRLVTYDVAVEEGEPAVLTSFDFAGGDPVVLLGYELQGVNLRGQRLDPPEVQRIAAAVARAHQARGYVAASAQARVDLSADGREARVVIEIDEGTRAFVRSVAVRGVRRTRPGRIEEELAVAVGDAASPASLASTRAALYQLDLFDFVDARWTGDDPGRVDLVIDVEEKPRASLEAGGGLATDVGLRAFSRGTVRHLWGLGHRVSGTVSVGFGYDGVGVLPELRSPEWRAALRYEAPNLPQRGQLTFVDALLNDRQQETTWRLSRTGGALGHALVRRDHFQLGLDARVQYRWLEDVDSGALLVGEPWTASDQRRWQAGFAASALYDGRDDFLNPTRGARLALEVEVLEPWSTGFFGVRVEGAARWIRPVGLTGLHLRLRGGVAWVPGPGTTVGVEDRFTLGGASTMRGFPVDTVGPKNRVPPDDLPWPGGLEPLAAEAAADRWVPVGGDAYGLATVEWWIPFQALGVSRAEGLSLVVFSDVGNVWLVDPGLTATSRVEDPEPLLRVSAGLGLRYATPVGPVQLDFGVNPLYGSAGWAEERGEVPWRFHLSLGAI